MRWRAVGAAGLFVASGLLLVPASAEAGHFDSLYVFGDSYSDSGNFHALTGLPPSPPYARRFSNGPTAVEYLAADFGIPFTASLDATPHPGGVNYAVAGAQTGTGNDYPPLSGTTGLINQVASFQSDLAAHKVAFSPASSLFILEGGGNDLFDLVGAEPPATIIANAAANIAAEATTLYGLGARAIAITSLFHIGLTPAGAASGFAGVLNALADQLNLAYANVVATLDGTLPGANVFILDSGGVINSIIGNAAAYGFADPTSPCLNAATFTVCGDPAAHLWWDNKHPTTEFHALIGNALAASVPEPASFALLGVGLLGLGLIRRRTRQGGGTI